MHCITSFCFLVRFISKGAQREDQRKEGKRVQSAYSRSFYSHCTASGLHPSTRCPSSCQAALFTQLYFLVLILPFSPCPFKPGVITPPLMVAISEVFPHPLPVSLNPSCTFINSSLFSLIPFECATSFLMQP